MKPQRIQAYDLPNAIGLLQGKFQGQPASKRMAYHMHRAWNAIYKFPKCCYKTLRKIRTPNIHSTGIASWRDIHGMHRKVPGQCRNIREPLPPTHIEAMQ